MVTRVIPHVAHLPVKFRLQPQDAVELQQLQQKEPNQGKRSPVVKNVHQQT